MGFDSPNYTQTPNALFDELLPTLGYAELKVLLWVIRQTLGWHGTWTGPKRSASLSATAAGTGLHREAVVGAFSALEARGLVEWRLGPRRSKEWRIVVDGPQTSRVARPVTSRVARPLGRGAK